MVEAKIEENRLNERSCELRASGVIGIGFDIVPG